MFDFDNTNRFKVSIISLERTIPYFASCIQKSDPEP